MTSLSATDGTFFNVDGQINSVEILEYFCQSYGMDVGENNQIENIKDQLEFWISGVFSVQIRLGTGWAPRGHIFTRDDS